MDTILVIDDDPLILDVVREILELDNYAVETALSGAEGIDKHRKHPADLVITDLIMPHKDGLSVISELKKEFPGVRIIAMTGTPKVEKLLAAVQADVNRVIAKPFDQEELLEAVAQLMDDEAAPAS